MSEQSQIRSVSIHPLFLFEVVMPQPYHTPGPRTGCSRVVTGLFWTKIVHGDGDGTGRAPYGHTRRPCGIFAKLWWCPFPHVPVRAPYGTLAGPARAPYGSRRIWKTFEIPVRGPYDDHTGTARGPWVVLRIIRSNHKGAAVSSRTGPLAWCDHENNTGVKFLRALHSALRARNLTGAKIVRGQWLDVTEALARMLVRLHYSVIT